SPDAGPRSVRSLGPSQVSAGSMWLSLNSSQSSMAGRCLASSRGRQTDDQGTEPTRQMSKGRRVRHGYIKSIVARVLVTGPGGASVGSVWPILAASQRPRNARKPRHDVVFRHELMERDPLGRKLTESLVRQHFGRPAKKETAELRALI